MFASWLHGPACECPALSCSSVVKVIEYLPNYLEELRDLPFGLKNRFIHLMSKRGLLSDSNLATILHSRLLNLDLSETDDVTDVGLQTIAATCRQLRKLDLNATKGNRENVSDAGKHAFLLGLVYIREASRTFCLTKRDQCLCTLPRSLISHYVRRKSGYVAVDR